MKILAGMINSKSTGILLKSLLELVQRNAPQDLTMDDLEIFDSTAYEARRSVDLHISFGRDLWAQGIKPFARFEFYNDGRGHIACDLYYGVHSKGKMLEERHVFFDHLKDFDEVLHRMLREFRGAKAMLKLKSNLKMVRKLFEKMYGKLNLEASARRLNAKADRVWCNISFVTIPSSFTGNEVTLLKNKGKTKSLKNEKLTPELIANLVGYREWLMSDEYDNLEELIEDVIKIADGKSKYDEADTFCYVPGSNDTVFIVVDNILPR